MTFKNDKVLEFYKELPFNIYGNLDSAVEQIRKYDPLKVYPELKPRYSIDVRYYDENLKAKFNESYLFKLKSIYNKIFK